jgi:hypothetical protein
MLSACSTWSFISNNLAHWMGNVNFHLGELLSPRKLHTSVLLQDLWVVMHLAFLDWGFHTWVCIHWATQGERTLASIEHCDSYATLCTDQSMKCHQVDKYSLITGEILEVVWGWMKHVWNMMWVQSSNLQFHRYSGDYIQLSSQPHCPHWGFIQTGLLLCSTLCWIPLSNDGICWRGMKHVGLHLRHLHRIREVEHLLGTLSSPIYQDGEQHK